jgi:hypothetical protein
MNKHQTLAIRKKTKYKECGTEYSVPLFAIQYSQSLKFKIVPPFFSSVSEPRTLDVISNGVYYDILFFSQKPLDFFCLAYYNKL